MEICIKRISTGFTGDYCFTHARGAVRPDGSGMITTQPLRLSGSDIFYGMHILKTADGGNSWSDIRPCEKLTRKPMGDGIEFAVCDCTPIWHKATGKWLLVGLTVLYKDDEFAPEPHKDYTGYSVYDEAAGDFTDLQIIEMPDEDRWFKSGNGCGQYLEEPDGTILMPIYHMGKEECCDSWHNCSSAAVLRCGFDGKTLQVLEIGNSLSVPQPRGLFEPSIVKHGNAYVLALRNDLTGYTAKSTDGLHFDEPVELCFDDGQNAGNYNTQQHWITGGGKLWMVYTRKGANNDHVFRNRAPLFIAEFDPDRMCLIRETERIVVPERGARLGNFGCCNITEDHAMVVVSEWMQTTEPDPFNWRRCMEYGSDNSIFVSHIFF